MLVNEGKTERVLRVLAGLALLIGLPLILSGPAKWWGVIGLLPLITGLVGYCPAWSLFGINTCRVKNSHEAPHRG
ncbi:DUF2892 domain-containing protein [Methylacidimicrobium sp. B4]|uniref:YgaP family membrane protein n=1 Tax=Methylacidimicrobium sp. B4 TaxID=2796139 RepID=UPI001A8FAB38|nr:DUF2892 domain-containing protein [Methylacidimicrobium sp. B4]QSR84635.1 DUF2892 domain-containing protein [Methylacidimicrobium sp. B4]